MGRRVKEARKGKGSLKYEVEWKRGGRGLAGGRGFSKVRGRVGRRGEGGSEGGRGSLKYEGEWEGGGRGLSNIKETGMHSGLISYRRSA